MDYKGQSKEELDLILKIEQERQSFYKGIVTEITCTVVIMLGIVCLCTVACLGIIGCEGPNPSKSMWELYLESEENESARSTH